MSVSLQHGRLHSPRPVLFESHNQHFNKAIAFIDAAKTAKGRILVHCQQVEFTLERNIPQCIFSRREQAAFVDANRSSRNPFATSNRVESVWLACVYSCVLVRLLPLRVCACPLQRVRLLPLCVCACSPLFLYP